MNIFKSRYMKIGLILLSLALFFSCATLTEVEYATLTIVHTNDTHGRVKEDKYDGMGFAKISTKLEELRGENPNLLLLDAGDTFHGTTLVSLSEGESIIRIMNQLGYDALAAGNHDFNYGYQRLLELDEITEFPVLAANIVDADGNLVFQQYVIKDINGLLVGIFGLATPETVYKTHPKNVEGLTFIEPVETAAEMVRILEKKAHVIIALVHLGIDEETQESWRSTYIAENVEGIDLIVDGHSHHALEEGMLVGDTLIVQAGCHDKNLGIVQLQYRSGEVEVIAELFTKDESAEIAEYPGILSIIEKIEEDNKVITEVVVGHTDVALDGERANVRTGSTNLGVLITDALLDVTGADFALQNGGGIRASIDVGPVTKGEIITVLPFGNTVAVLEITGAQMVEAIENGISGYPEASGAYPHVGGLTFTFDETKPAGSRVIEVLVNGSPINLNKTYTLATNDFLAAGGDKYTMLMEAKKIAEYGTLDDIVVDFMNR